MEKYSKDHIKVNRDGTSASLSSALISVVESGDGDASVCGGRGGREWRIGGSLFSPGIRVVLPVGERAGRKGGRGRPRPTFRVFVPLAPQSSSRCLLNRNSFSRIPRSLCLNCFTRILVKEAGGSHIPPEHLLVKCHVSLERLSYV